MIRFDLNPRLEGDSLPVADLPLCAVRLMKDANYPWLLLIPRQADLVEITDLTQPNRLQLMDEIAACADALKAVTACDKINIGALGNVVSQLHVHVIARFRSDAAWPNPVWGAAPARTYEPAELTALTERLRPLLPA